MSDIVERAFPTAEEITENWGEQCPDYDSECPCCFVWRMHDAYQRLRDELASAREIIGDRAIERADAREALFPEMSARIKAERQSAKAAAFEEAELVMSEICSHDKLVGQIAAFLLERDEQTTQDERDEGERETSAFYIEQMVHRAFSAAIRSRAQEGR